MAIVNILNATIANINHFRYLHQSYDNAFTNLMKLHCGTLIMIPLMQQIVDAEDLLSAHILY